MVRNWQNRVELVTARRLESKQRKLKVGDKREYKAWSKEWLEALDRNQDQFSKAAAVASTIPKDNIQSKPWKLYLWTDALAGDKQQRQQKQGNNKNNFDDFDDDGKGKGKGRKMRSVSIEIELEDNNNKKGKGRKGGKGRGRSNSNAAADNTPSNNSKKKAHPRSHKDEESKEEKAPQAWMCRSFFFTGKCNDLMSSKKGAKSGGCKYIHSSINENDELPLCKVISKKKTSDSLEESEDAVRESSTNDSVNATQSQHLELGAMEMAFYMEIELKLNLEAGADNDDNTISTQITTVLALKQLKLSSIVYGVVNDAMIFDRYRGGNLHETDEELLAALHILRDATSAATTTDGSNDKKVAEYLPGIVLEHILKFLPDTAVPSASRVCKAWYHEIGKNSPNLWKHMLDRNAWPHPSATDAVIADTGIVGGASQGNLYREQFLQHYSVLRDLKAIQAGVGAIMDPRKREKEEFEMAYQDFSARRDAPAEGACVGLEIWSPRRLLGAYDDDCSLRLFETLPKPGRDGELVCRELVCQSFDPYRNTRKRESRVFALGLDEQCVAAFLRVISGSGNSTKFVLVVMSRDDFLIGDSGGGISEPGTTSDGLANLNVIDVSEAVVHYLLSLDGNVSDHRLQQCIDFVSHGGDIEEVWVKVSPTIASCGHGRFLVEASISIPIAANDDNGNDNDNNDNGGSLMIDRKLFLISAGTGSIVWMGESNPLSQELRHRNEEMIISCHRRPQEGGGSRSACCISVGSATSPALLVGEIGPASGDFPSFQLLDSSLLVRNEIVDNGWEIHDRRFRPILVTPSVVVAADVLIQVNADDGLLFRPRRSILSFYPRDPTTDTPSYTTMTISGNVEVFRMSCIGDHHIVLVCRVHQNTSAADLQGSEVRNTEAIIVHISGECEIGRTTLLYGDDRIPSIWPYLVADNNRTVGCGIRSRGIVMTGGETRAVAHEKTSAPSQSLSKGKKQQKNQGVKKTQAARGRNTSSGM